MKIIELELKTHLLSKMKMFYVNQLHFPLLQETENAFTLLVGNTKLTFVRENGESQPFYHFAMNIPANQIHEAKDWLLQQGVPLIPALSMEAVNIQAENNVAVLKELMLIPFTFTIHPGTM